jgi:four helix bundle protein
VIRQLVIRDILVKFLILKNYILSFSLKFKTLKMKQEDFNEQFRNRTKANSVKTIKIVSKIKYSDESSVLKKQLVRCSTSVTANFRSVCRARSENEKYAKLCIVVEEADETLLWLEMFVECEIISQDTINDVYNEVLEILKVMSAFKLKLKPKA